MSKHNQIAVIIISILIINGKSIQVIQDRNSNPIENSTTLYPVERNVFIKSETVKNKDNKIKSENLNRETNWNINATFALPTDDYEGEKDEAAVNKHTAGTVDNGRNYETVPRPNLFSFPKDERSEEDWEKGKIDSDKTNKNAAASKDTGKDKVVDQSTQKKEFKPSPHLSSYLDTLEDSPLRSFTSFPQFEKNPSSSFHKSPHAQYEHSNKFPQDFVAFPYKYENNVMAQANAGWNFHGLQSKPTDEAPVSIPAGGLYRNPDFLKDKPIYYEGDEDFNLDVHTHSFKDGSLKKRSNPWNNLLHLVTSLLPVGLIISALTPSVITVQNTGADLQKFKRLSRRSDEDQSIPAVSEQCKRRLLCEIHSERNYQSTATPYRSKRCYKIRCEDPQAVFRVLNWLLTYHNSQDGRGRGYT